MRDRDIDLTSRTGHTAFDQPTINVRINGEIRRSDTVEDSASKITVMAVADGYVMCRRPRCTPFVRTVKEWNALVNFKSIACCGSKLKDACLTPDGKFY